MGIIQQNLGIYSGGVAASPPVVTKITANEILANSSTHNHGTLSIGAASADRAIIVSIAYGAASISDPITGMTLGGVAMTKVVGGVHSTSAGSAIYILAVPSGTTANITATFSGTNEDSRIVIYSVTGLLSTTAVDSDTQNSASQPVTYSHTLNTSNDGFIIGVVACQNASSFSWTGLTEVYDARVNDNSFGEAFNGATSSPSTAVSCTSSDDNSCYCVASFR